MSEDRMPIPVAARSKAQVYGPSPVCDCGFESDRGHGCLLWMFCVVR